MLDRHDLTDEEWARLEPLLPDRAPCRGGRWADHRTVINGVFWRSRTGCPWRDLPGCYGNWKAVYNRHRRWSAEGTRGQILDELRRGCDQNAQGAVDPCWAVGTDSTVVRAHQHAAGARRSPPPHLAIEPAGESSAPPRRLQGAPSNDKDGAADGDRESLGRSRGGLSTKIHLAADDRCRPIARVITADQRHDTVAFQPLMRAIQIPRRGHPLRQTRHIFASTADVASIRIWLRDPVP